MSDLELTMMRRVGELNKEVARLKAEVERLRKAGDAMYESKIGYYGEQILEDMKHHSGNCAATGTPPRRESRAYEFRSTPSVHP